MSFVRIVRLGLEDCEKCRIFASLKTNETMNSKILKLDAPYNVIYAGGKIGRHIATLITWGDDPDGSAEIMEAHQYPIIDQGEELPAGTLVTAAELEDCRTLCPINAKTGKPGTNLYWLSNIIEYDFQQLEPAGAEYILERLKLLGCTIKLPTEEVKDKDGDTVYGNDGEKVTTTVYDYQATLSISPTKGSWEESPEYIVKSNKHEGLYFEAYGSEEEIYNDLAYQLSVYNHSLLEGIGSVRFRTNDGMLASVINRLNEKQGIESNAIDIR